jgi:hypothetical protein
VEAGSNTSNVALRALEATKRELGHPVPGGYIYGDLALQVGSLESETIKFGHESSGIGT